MLTDVGGYDHGGCCPGPWLRAVTRYLTRLLRGHITLRSRESRAAGLVGIVIEWTKMAVGSSGEGLAASGKSLEHALVGRAPIL